MGSWWCSLPCSNLATQLWSMEHLPVCIDKPTAWYTAALLQLQSDTVVKEWHLLWVLQFAMLRTKHAKTCSVWTSCCCCCCTVQHANIKETAGFSYLSSSSGAVCFQPCNSLHALQAQVLHIGRVPANWIQHAGCELIV